MKMYNASLEKYKIQCDSRVLVFSPQSYTEVPDSLYPFVYEQMKYKGVFVANDWSESDERFIEAKRQALLNYLGITLRERIVNYLAFQDEQRKRGATIIPDTKLERAVRWEKELRQILNAEKPIEEELSFLEAKRTENTVLEEKKEEESSFSDEKRKPGRPKKDSFVEVAA